MHIPIGEAPRNIDEFPIYIAQKYIKDPLTIILCVIPANQLSGFDYYALSGLRIAKEMNVLSENNSNNLRRICVLTKIDIMDKGSDVKDVLLNKTIPNDLGYIGVVNRSKIDVMENITNDEILEKEKNFFNTNEIYKDLAKDFVGNDALIKKITKVYFKLIKDNLDNNLKNNEKMKELLDLIDEYSLKEDEISKIENIKKNEELPSKKKLSIMEIYSVSL